MNAKEAYELAASQNNISHYLDIIKAAASKGETHILVRLLNDFQVAELTRMGYWVYKDHGPDVYAIAGRQEATHHRISWHNGGIKDGDKAQSLASALGLPK